MPKKLQKMDIREVALKVRTGVDAMQSDDLGLLALLGFFHRTLLQLVQKLQIPMDIEVLNSVVTNYIQHNKNLEGFGEFGRVWNRLEGYSIVEICDYFNQFLNSTDNLVELMYFFGFTQGILNRIMRKLGIDHQIPPPFSL